MTLLDAGMFFGLSFVAASINAVAGGGTFLTFPAFIFAGLTTLQANIMSTIALWPGTIASSLGYRQLLSAELKPLRPFLLIGLFGGAGGAFLLLSTPEMIFKSLVPWLLLAATLIFTFGRIAIAYLRKFLPADKENKTLGLCVHFVNAIYGGYFGAGMGILTLAMLQLLGRTHIHQMNAVKTVLTATINSATMLIFLFSGKVVWPLAFVMIAGAVLGGYFGARMALKVSPEKVRLLVSTIGFGMSLYFFTHSA